MNTAALSAFARRSAAARAELLGVDVLYGGVPMRICVGSQQELQVLESGGQFPEASAVARFPIELMPTEPEIDATITTVRTGRSWRVAARMNIAETGAEWVCRLEQL